MGIGALGVLTVLAVVLVWYRSTTASSGDEVTDGETDVWEAVPSRQYEGRHAESDGISRGEQERALQGIQQQVDEMTDDASQR